MFAQSELVVLFCIIQIVLGQLTLDRDKVLNWCLNGKHHKNEPGPEDQLHEKTCAPWKERSCCTHNTSESIDSGSMYNLNFDHCKGHKMSKACRRHFVQDLCFYECDPNLGPWVIKVNQKYRKERAMNVPLCADDCDEWFDDCRKDFTCVENWIRELVTMNNIKQCPLGKECKTFEEIYGNSSNFCEKVWDFSWKYTQPDKPCMKIWFDATQGNPNRKVAELKADEIGAKFGAASSSFTSTIVAMVLTIFITLFVCQ